MTTYHFENETSLNISEEQNKFIKSTSNFTILDACAGSGKTRSLLVKVKQLIDQNIKPSDLIICTYTKAMAYVIKNKIKYHFDINLMEGQIGTFHSICYKLIKPLIFDQIGLIESIPTTDYNCEIASPEEILVYTYEHLLNNNINLNSKYIIIDEYQDCSSMQQKILNHLLKKGELKGLYLIGDRNQSIYSFNNSETIEQWTKQLININIPLNSIQAQLREKDKTINKLISSKSKDFEQSRKLMLSWKKLGIIVDLDTTSDLELEKNNIKQNDLTTNYTKFSTFNLTTNYRSTIEIVNLANCFKPIEDKMTSVYTFSKYTPKLFIFNNLTDEINYLCNVISEFEKKNRFKKLGSLCIISRYNKTLEIIEDRLIGQFNINCNYIKYNNKIVYNCVNLCTIHSAKGLEFDNVYFVNSSYEVLSNNSDKEIKIDEEESRLFYVAITRAKKQLILSSNKGINQLIINKVFDNKIDINKLIDTDKINNKLIEIHDNRTILDKKQKNNIISSDNKTFSWLGVTDLVKLLSGDHIINIKKILTPIINFKPIVKKVHNGLFDDTPNCEKNKTKKIPAIFNDIKIISNTQNVFGLFIDALIMRHIQYLKVNQSNQFDQTNQNINRIEYQDLNKLVLLYYLNNKTDITQLDIRQIDLLKNLYNMTDAIFKSNILLDKLDKSSYSVSNKISSNFEKKLRSSYLKFTDPKLKTIDILYDIFIISLTNPILNERMSYQYLPQYISESDINDTNTVQTKKWYEEVLTYVETLYIRSSGSIEVQTELSNHYLKIIGFADIIIPSNNCIIDVKTSIYQYPKLEYLLQIIIYGLLHNITITNYHIYNPIYGIVYEWTFKDDRTNKIYLSNVKQKLIDYISSILPELKNKRSYLIK
jgi:hypothetical protein